MQKWGWFLLATLLAATLLVSSCASMNAGKDKPVPAEPMSGGLSMREQNEAGHWVSGSQNGLLTIIGVSNPLQRRESEIESAREDAARKAAMFHDIQGSVRTVNRTGSGFLDYVFDSSVDLLYDSDYEKYLDKLNFDPDKDVFRIDGAVFVRMQYPAVNVPEINYTPAKNSDGSPVWINSANLPAFEGYTTVVGFARNQRWLKDTITKSSDDAVARLIESATTQVTTVETVVSSYGASVVIYTHSTGRLMNFQALEFWIDPASGAVWTLAIARVINDN